MRNRELRQAAAQIVQTYLGQEEDILYLLAHSPTQDSEQRRMYADDLEYVQAETAKWKSYEQECSA